MKRIAFGAAALGAALLLAGGATATTPPQATSVVVAGAFTNAVPDLSNPGTFELCGAPVQPTCASLGYSMPPPVQVRWGQPASSNGQSGLGFGTLAPSAVGLNQNFVLGSLSHFNWVVYGALSSVDLTVRLTAQTGDGPIDFTLPFSLGIDETPNTGTVAACTYQPAATACPDAIKLPPGGTFVSHTQGSHDYTLTVVGFTSSQTDLTQPASLLVTQEGQVTQGFLVANLSRTNAAPVAGDDSASTVSGGSTGPIDVLGNDSDADHDAFSVSAISTPPAHGTATINSDGTITYTADSAFAGDDTFRYVDSDGIDTSSPATVTVHVADTTDPVIAVPPGGISTEATGPGTVVNYTASATDNVDGSIGVDCVPPSGSAFPVGTTVVTCTATDTHGNSTSSTFDVTIVDSTGPAFSDVPSSQHVEATGPGGAIGTYTPPTATDLVDGAVSVDCKPPSGSTFQLGANSVECTATDTAGNTSTATFVVTVEDTTGPQLTLPGDMTVFSGGGSSTTVAYDASASDLVDGAVTVTCTPPSGSTFPVGDTLVTCSATDHAGNTSTGSFTVTVVANRPPTCSAVVVAGASALWPVNHKLVLVSLTGATDPDGNTVTYRIEDVTQDEALTGAGSGKTNFDAQRASGGSVWLRSERAGTGDGRVYTIAFTVTDQHGLACSGTVDVGVPHDASHAAHKSAVSVDSFGS